MKHLILGILLLGLSALLGLAGPAAAIDQGECCASVGSVCISTCQQSSCTGNGDCELALTSRPAGTSRDTPEIRASYRTLSRQDRYELDKIMSDDSPARAGGKDDEEPAEGGLAAPEGSRSYIPKLIPQGGGTALVPMKHGSCGLDCGTHELAVQGGNLDASFKISMSCPAGTEVLFLAYQLKGKNQVKVVDGATGSSFFSQDLTLQPYSASDLEESCRVALGGDWPTPGHHKNPSKSVKTELQEPIKVWGQCTGWANKLLRTYPAELEVTCDDQSWSP